MTKQSKSEVAKTNENKLPRFEEAEEGVWNIHALSEIQISDLFGGGSEEFAKALLLQCGKISGTREKYRDDKNDAVAMIAEIAPQDGVEAMLATQMASVHIAMMRHSKMMAGADYVEQLAVQERTFNKLARTFTSQIEALRKHRHGGDQKITVEHVTVNDGGQAIVGSVRKGGQ